MFGYSNEICGENGLGWSRRMMMFARSARKAEAAGKGGGLMDPMAEKYGYQAEVAQAAPGRVAEIIGALAKRLEDQRASGSRFFIGNQLSALDIYWATFSGMCAPLGWRKSVRCLRVSGRFTVILVRRWKQRYRPCCSNIEISSTAAFFNFRWNSRLRGWRGRASLIVEARISATVSRLLSQGDTDIDRHAAIPPTGEVLSSRFLGMRHEYSRSEGFRIKPKRSIIRASALGLQIALRSICITAVPPFQRDVVAGFAPSASILLG